ncbi:MAG: hypothetical protein IH863_06390 [Chloroflexi bacterium]|nr:hypothetical protein [Chloroflexota bacterium]
MTEDHELHLPDALTHAAVPPPAPPPAAAPNDALAVESGAVVNRIEELFPLVWLGMLTVVSVVGIYSAASKLP